MIEDKDKQEEEKKEDVIEIVRERTFKVGDRELRVSLPDGKLLDQGSLIHKASYAKALREGCLIRAEVDRFVKEKDVWNEIDDAEVAELAGQLQNKEDQLSSDDISNEEKTKIAAEMTEIRVKMMAKTAERNSFYQETADGYADERRTEFYTINCVTDASTGKPVFKDMDDYYAQLDDEIAQESFLQMTLLLAGIEPDFLMNFPESLFLMQQGLSEYDRRLKSETEDGEDENKED